MNSYWIDSVPNILKEHKSLDKDLNVDVCIVGGGITGITCAYMLSSNGFKVALLEKDLLACKTTGNTTGKITSQHGIFYKYLIDTFGHDFAKSYLDANEYALKNIKEIIKSNNIACDFSIQDAYIYTQNEADVQKIKDEVNAVNSLGFNSEFVTNISLPISNIKGAIKFPSQAQFHPRKYLTSLCEIIKNNNGKIFENSRVYDIKKEDSEYVTYTENNKVKSKYVILATRYPIINFPGFYFLKMYQEMSYIIGVETNSNLFDGMYISSGSPTLSFRTTNYNGRKLLLIAGMQHKVGAKIDLKNAYNYLEETAKNLYPDSKILYKWQTEDSISLDKIPYIGQFSELMPNMYVATGFKKWGMTSSNIAANIITDNILGDKNPYEKTFLSTRFHPIKNKQEFGNILKESTYSLVINKFKIPDESLNDVKNDEGKIIEINNEKVGVYKDNNGTVFAVKPKCTHLGCELSWNDLEKTWDCPCHGSRFDYKGINIYDPAIKNLDRLL